MADIFDQFTQILDILQAILKHKSITYLMLTGSTPVDVRQTLVDEFTEDESIPVFLLSTKAGGEHLLILCLPALTNIARNGNQSYCCVGCYHVCFFICLYPDAVSMSRCLGSIRISTRTTIDKRRTAPIE